LTREFAPQNSAIMRAERCRRQGRAAEAVRLCHGVLQTQPNSYEAEYVLGLITHQNGKSGEAIQRLRRAALLAPELAFLHAALGEMHWLAGHVNEAANASLRALALHAQFPEPLNNLARVALSRGQADLALDYCRQAIALNPHFAAAHDNLGSILRELGQLDQAEQAYASAIRFAPDDSGFVGNFSNVHRFYPGDPRIAAIEALREKGDLSDLDRLRLDFALGKAYVDLGDHRRGFERFLAANAAKRDGMDYDENSTLALFGKIERLFTPEFIREKSGSGNPSTVPIFILGMPRSGTTLVEQILATHPQIHGGGELSTLQQVMQSTQGADGRPILGPKFLAELDARMFGEIGTRYLENVCKLAPAAPHVTDKMPINYFFVGLIYLALPRAKIIHVIRDPLDTCISCFSTLFTGEINYAYDLGELGRYYRHYDRLMGYWRKLLPPGHMLDVRYENVVADLEGETRRMLSYCELDWHPECVDFHKTDRIVRTASAVQVRQPLYRSSIGRWRAYEPYIGALRAELGSVPK
jgi:Flp pilus assembly protein TadD